MDPFTIAALTAMIGGSYLQHQAQQDALRRQQQAIREGLERQRQLQIQGEQTAMRAAQDFAPEARTEKQQQIADQTAENLAAPVSESQAIRAEQQTTQGETSDAYKAAKAKSDLQALQNAQVLARLLGKVSSAGRLRTDEAIGLMNAGQKIDQLNSFSRGNQAADQIAIQSAGVTDPTQMFIGSVLKGVGSAGLMGASGGGLSAAGIASKYGTMPGSQQTAALWAQEAGMGGGGFVDAFRDKFNGWFK